ncbi:PQQ-binding-like beta-propeller repeat protein [Streptomyces sp. NPDC048337]|uniref:protein kinase domain-containing protein n=1 Tax=Streptomyces sp. NPDC048337 TaxID=3365535 RepID=UPI0037177619
MEPQDAQEPQGPRPPLEPLDPSDPLRIGPYALLGRLGAGGMGAVYLGRSAGGRTVAVKLVRPELAADADFRARFRAEVTAARAVSGAFTAPVVDADPDGPVPWMATAFVPGVSLGRAVAIGGPLPESALGSLAAGIAEALESIHAAGLTHRDLKPGNVLLALDGPHVIDFGIARATDGTALTATGMILGTPSYMSPEQATAAPLGPASDVFSLGATLAFASRGSGVFDGGRPVDVLKRVVREEPDLSAVPDSLRLLVSACLSKDPADRPTPREVVQYVERVAAPRPAGAWLPPALITAIEEAAAVMAPAVTASTPPPGGNAPAPPYAPQPGLQPADQPADQPVPTPPPSGPSRRRLLLGVAAGTVALAGGGTGLGLWLTRDGSGKSSGAKSSSHALTDPERPLGTEVTATPLWTAPVAEPLVQIAGEGETVLALSAKNIWAVGRTGAPLWGPLAKPGDPVYAPLITNVAAIGGGLVFTVAPAGASVTSKILRAIRLDNGAEAWTLPLPQQTATNVSVLGLLDGQVYITGTSTTMTMNPSADPKDKFQYRSGPFVCTVDPAQRKVTWAVNITDPDTQYSQGKLFLPSSGNQLMWVSANTDGSAPKIAGIPIGGQGRGTWEQPAPGAAGSRMDAIMQGAGGWADGAHSSAGGFFLHVTDGLYAIDPANGQVAWQSPKVPFKAVVASPDGKTVYAAGRGTGLKALSILVYAFDAANGNVRWAGAIDGGVNIGMLGLQSADDTVYLAAGGKMWAMNAQDGKARWTYELNATVTYSQVPLWAGGGRVYGNGPKGLVAISASGTTTS